MLLTAHVDWQKAVAAITNKNARILWAVLAKGQRFDPDYVSSKPGGAVAVDCCDAAGPELADFLQACGRRCITQVRPAAGKPD